MKKIIVVLSVLLLISAPLFAQDRFDRTAVIPADTLDIGGFGNIIAGVDFDNDGKPEIYAVNNDWHDKLGYDLTPRMYKYEQNDLGKWEVVWSTELDMFLQNTWPAMAAADLDKDGRMEIVYGPVNNLKAGVQENPERIVVFETAGDGSDVMGVPGSDGMYRPNAQWTITDKNMTELRPFRWFINDIDQDGTDEIVAALRKGDDRAQIYSVDNVPDNGDSSETWTLEFSGTTGTDYDAFILDSTFYPIQSGGSVTPITWSASGDSFRVGAVQANVVPHGSWNSATVVDLDGDEINEVLVASWSSSASAVYLVQRDADTLKTTMIADVPNTANRLYGGAAGDLDGDGMIDYVFGSRQSTPNGMIFRLEYQGGDITDMNNYQLSVMDFGVSKAVQYDVIAVGDMDSDGMDEVVYTGTPRGQSAEQPPQPIVILDMIPPNQPIVRSVKDIPNDQGRFVRVGWQGSYGDMAPEGNMASSAFMEEPITEYSVWRKIEPGLSKKSLGKIMNINGATWEQVGLTKAVQAKMYAAVVPTLVDMVPGGSDLDPISTFAVVAHTNDPLTNWKSFPKRGFSVDNLSPMAPANVMAKEIFVDNTRSGVQITWDESQDEDFKYFAVYRSENPGINTNVTTPLATMTGTDFVDDNVAVGATYYYAITAYDFNKNQSDPTEVNYLVTGVNDENMMPTEYALEQNYPNPFNPTTTINFSLKESGHVTLRVYSTLGQEIASIADKFYERGRHSVTFDAGGIASGVYFYVLKVNDITFRKKMSVLK